MHRPAHDPEAARQRRLEREEREAREALAQHQSLKRSSSTVLGIVGGVALLVGLWFLLFAPSQANVEGIAIANLHRLYLGQALTLVGPIFITGASVIRTR